MCMRCDNSGWWRRLIYPKLYGGKVAVATISRCPCRFSSPKEDHKLKAAGDNQ